MPSDPRSSGKLRVGSVMASYRGRLGWPDGSPEWLCNHEHKTSDEARKCAAEERLRRMNDGS